MVNLAVSFEGAGDGSCHVWKMALSFTDYRSKSPSALDSPNV